MSKSRRDQAYDVRVAAANLAATRVHPQHIANGDEQKFRTGNQPNYLASFTKGMRHNYKTGLIEDANDFQQFVKGIDSGDPRDFIDTPLGPDGYEYKPNISKPDKVWFSFKAKDLAKNNKKTGGLKLRAWESQAAGNVFDLEGPDPKAVTMPPAPILGSHELTAEMGEVYAQALLRDVPFTKILEGVKEYSVKCAGIKKHKKVEVAKILNELASLPWFGSNDCCKITDAKKTECLSSEEKSRVRTNLDGQTFFRGITPGDDIGPYISQFLLAGNEGLNGNGVNDENHEAKDGYINYGAITIDQRVRFAKPCDDHMTLWDEWYDVQQAADLTGMEEYDDITHKLHKHYRRFITTPRDMATYVHYDALYESYLNACLILLDKKIPFDPGLPFQRNDFIDHQQAFAHFGGPHILTLVTEVATRALKAVRAQKFNVHRRMRPEVLAARLAKHQQLNVPEVDAMVVALSSILNRINASNGDDLTNFPKGNNFLLPMAFCEGSPMHPAYGAGHATVAGACVTILKAFFDHKHPLKIADNSDERAFVADEATHGLTLKTVDVVDAHGGKGKLTVEGELNKLASNISIGRDWAGVHYFTDYIESLRMGEQIAIGILEEQKLTYGETFSMTIPLFDSASIRV